MTTARDAALILRLRTLVGDPADAPTFEDDDLQDFLDERSTHVVEAQLYTRPSGADGSYLDFYVPRAPWEDTVVLTDADGTALDPETSDLTGVREAHWTFTTQPSLPVYVTGRFFDLYGTAAAVCDAWAAKVAREFDFVTDQQRFDRTGKREGLLAVARAFARKASRGTRPAWHSLDW